MIVLLKYTGFFTQICTPDGSYFMLHCSSGDITKILWTWKQYQLKFVNLLTSHPTKPKDDLKLNDHGASLPAPLSQWLSAKRPRCRSRIFCKGGPKWHFANIALGSRVDEVNLGHKIGGQSPPPPRCDMSDILAFSTWTFETNPSTCVYKK